MGRVCRDVLSDEVTLNSWRKSILTRKYKAGLVAGGQLACLRKKRRLHRDEIIGDEIQKVGG